jgi:hypothetical protein
MNELPRKFQPGLALHRGAAFVAPRGAGVIAPRGATVDVMTGEEVARCRRWPRAFAGGRKDSRYYEIVSRGIRQGFDYRYFALRDAPGEVRAVAPFFVLDQDLCAAMISVQPALATLRKVWPRFLTARTLMVGCAAGEGHLDGDDEMPHDVQVRLLRDWVPFHAERLGAPLVVFKEFPAKYRGALGCLLDDGYTRVPSYPMTRLDIDYPSFEAYMADALSRKTRRDLRLKFRAAAAAAPITLTVTSDVTERIGELYPLYSQVFARSKWRFEKLTPEYFCALGQRMPDKVRYFVWNQGVAPSPSACAWSKARTSSPSISGSITAAPSTFTSTTTPSATWCDGRWRTATSISAAPGSIMIRSSICARRSIRSTSMSATARRW